MMKKSFSKECKKSKQFYTNILQPFEFLLTKTFAYSFAVKKLSLNFEIREIFCGICVEYFYFNRKRSKRQMMKKSFSKECKRSKQFYTNILQPFEFLLIKTFAYSFAVKKIKFGLTLEFSISKKDLLLKIDFSFKICLVLV